MSGRQSSSNVAIEMIIIFLLIIITIDDSVCTIPASLPADVCPTFNPTNSVTRESRGTMSRVCVCVSVYACLCVYMRVRACVHGLVSAVAAVGVDCSWSWELVGC